MKALILGCSIFFFVESKTYEFSIEEGGTYYMLHTFERNQNSLQSIFIAKESAKHLLAIVESHVIPGNYARTFKDGDKIFILQLGSNAHGSFFMISELVHGKWKGFIVVPAGNLGSGWRGFGFHLRKAIASETLAIKPPAQSDTSVSSSPTLAHSAKVTNEADNEILGSDKADETKNGSVKHWLGKHLQI